MPQSRNGFFYFFKLHRKTHNNHFTAVSPWLLCIRFWFGFSLQIDMKCSSASISGHMSSEHEQLSVPILNFNAVLFFCFFLCPFRSSITRRRHTSSRNIIHHRPVSHWFDAFVDWFHLIRLNTICVLLLVSYSPIVLHRLFPYPSISFTENLLHFNVMIESAFISLFDLEYFAIIFLCY